MHYKTSSGWTRAAVRLKSVKKSEKHSASCWLHCTPWSTFTTLWELQNSCWKYLCDFLSVYKKNFLYVFQQEPRSNRVRNTRANSAIRSDLQWVDERRRISARPTGSRCSSLVDFRWHSLPEQLVTFFSRMLPARHQYEYEHSAWLPRRLRLGWRPRTTAGPRLLVPSTYIVDQSETKRTRLHSVAGRDWDCNCATPFPRALD